MPHVALIREYAVLTDRDEIFQAMAIPRLIRLER